MKEEDLVRRFRELFSPVIGDDAAVVDSQVVTTDMLIEDVDFTRAAPLPLVARKALAVNISDLAAMGAVPTYAVVALGLPPWSLAGIDPFLVALRDAAIEWRIEIIGGDLSRAAKLTIAITAMGRIEKRALFRTGARPGDRIYVSRPIGGAMAGLLLLQQGWAPDGTPPRQLAFPEREFGQSAIRRHLAPEPELDLGIALAAIEQVTSCIDISDGLSTDLNHLCEASHCGAEIERERIPVFPDLLGTGTRLGINAQQAVLDGGEEYALLFTSSLRESELSSRLKRPVYAIGHITPDRALVLIENGVPRLLEPGGWDHFG